VSLWSGDIPPEKRAVTTCWQLLYFAKWSKQIQVRHKWLYFVLFISFTWGNLTLVSGDYHNCLWATKLSLNSCYCCCCWVIITIVAQSITYSRMYRIIGTEPTVVYYWRGYNIAYSVHVFARSKRCVHLRVMPASRRGSWPSPEVLHRIVSTQLLLILSTHSPYSQSKSLTMKACCRPIQPSVFKTKMRVIVLAFLSN